MKTVRLLDKSLDKGVNSFVCEAMLFERADSPEESLLADAAITKIPWTDECG